MQSVLSLFLFSSLASAAAPLVCNADYCLRGLRAANIPGRVVAGSADCSAFMRTTLTPATYTSTTVITAQETAVVTVANTIYVTISQSGTVYSIYSSGIVGRDVAPTPAKIAARDAEPAVTPPAVVEKRITPTPAPAPAAADIPAYAMSVCSGAARYSSACSCIGISAATQTAATPTYISTSISTSTSTFLTSTTVTTNLVPESTITVCEPPAYGFLYTNGRATPAAGVVGARYSFPSRTDITDQQGCCAFCFQTPGCFAYTLDYDGYCNLSALSSGTSPLATDECPSGPIIAHADVAPAGEARFGYGACAIYQGPPQS